MSTLIEVRLLRCVREISLRIIIINIVSFELDINVCACVYIHYDKVISTITMTYKTDTVVWENCRVTARHQNVYYGIIFFILCYKRQNICFYWITN